MINLLLDRRRHPPVFGWQHWQVRTGAVAATDALLDVIGKEWGELGINRHPMTLTDIPSKSITYHFVGYLLFEGESEKYQVFLKKPGIPK